MKSKFRKKIKVFVSLSADGLHHGHLNILIKAKKYGNIIVGLMTDKAIKSYKKSKPLMKYNDRKKLLSHVDLVSKIIPVHSLNFAQLANKHKLDYWIHGSDWKKGVQCLARKKLIKEMKKWGGKVIDIPYTKGISNTIIKKKYK